jgi:hypothetical protein
MSIEYIELKEDQPNVFWEDSKPTLYVDQNLLVELPSDSIYHYAKINKQIKQHGRYCLRTLNKQNLVLEFMPFASRQLREYLNDNNDTKSQVPLITWYNNSYIIYISHNNQSALLKVTSEDVDNDFLDIIDKLYGID